MKNLLRSFLTLLFLLSPPASGIGETLSSDKDAPRNLKITVLVYNMAKVPSQVLALAEGEASRIFQEADVQMEWMECPCSPSLGSTDVMLRIIPRLFGSMKADFRQDDLGFAPSSEEGGVLATIFFHRVEAVTKGGSVAPILGNAIAHELGHLLLGPKAHSSIGIMTAHWSRELLKLASRGFLHFTSEQAELMRAHVSARRKQQEVLQPSMMVSLRRDTDG
jgi:hypothetical protein